VCSAANSGSIEVLEWLRQQEGVEIGAGVLAAGAGGGHIAMCEHYRLQGASGMLMHAVKLLCVATLTLCAGFERMVVYEMWTKCVMLQQA
jgi:hypothetical protein